MKATVKATGKIIEVKSKAMTSPVTRKSLLKYVDQKTGISYFEEELLFLKDLADDPDYWTRLEHQAAIAAMQALLSSDTMMGVLLRRDNGTMEEEVAREAFDYAHALVEKYKKEERK